MKRNVLWRFLLHMIERTAANKLKFFLGEWQKKLIFVVVQGSCCRIVL